MSDNATTKPTVADVEAINKVPKSTMMALRGYSDAIGKGISKMLGGLDNYQAICGYNILAQINVLLLKEGLDYKSPKVDRETINNAIKYAMIYSLNTDNKEVFAIIRNENRGTKDQPMWVKVIEVKPQYRGTLKILSDFGRNVKKVYPEWIVREGDDFKYQTFKGVEVVPPEWSPHGYEGKILRVVVPVEYNDGFIDYRVAERDSVATNIKAQIKQSLMNNKEVKNKDEILVKIQDMDLDQLLSDKTILPFVNDTYTGISKEEMLITKLVINAVKRVQIDYSSIGGQVARELNESTFDNADVYKKNHTADELLAMANAPAIDMQEVETKPQPKVDADGVVGDNPADLFQDPPSENGDQQ